jgi:hypothetical protein
LSFRLSYQLLCQFACQLAGDDRRTADCNKGSELKAEPRSFRYLESEAACLSIGTRRGRVIARTIFMEYDYKGRLPQNVENSSFECGLVPQEHVSKSLLFASRGISGRETRCGTGRPRSLILKRGSWFYCSHPSEPVTQSPQITCELTRQGVNGGKTATNHQ